MQYTKTRLATAIAAALLTSQIQAQGGLVLEEITVTAQKTTELIQDVPVTVNAVTGDDFEQKVAFEMQDLGKLVPGLVLESTGNNQNITLRGVGTKISAAQSPRINTYLDGSYVNNQQLSFFSQFDIARFEVLRGPQGTLYGKASPSGSIVIHTRNPDLTGTEGFVQTSVGQHDLFNTQFGVSIPIVQNELGVRLAGVYDENNSADGEYENVPADQLVRNKSGRMTFLWEPDSALTARLSYTHVNYDSNQSSAFAEAPALGVDRYDRIELSDQERYVASRFDQTVLELNYDLEWAVVTSQTYFAQGTNDELKDTDRTSAPAAFQKTNINFNHIFNQDLRLSSTGNETWDWITGLYYANNMADTTVVNSSQGGLVTADVGLLSSSEDWGVFTHNTFFLSDRWTLTAGARWSRETRANENGIVTTLLPPIPGAGVYPGLSSSETKYIDWTGTLKLAYNLDVDQLVYITIDRGGRSGGQTLDLSGFTPDEIQEFDPETSTSFEVGYKSDLLDRRLRLNASAYYQVYDDFHYQAEDAPIATLFQGNQAFDLIQNANEAIVSGAELDVTYLFNEHFSGQMLIAYNDAKFEEFEGAACSDGVPVAGSTGTYLVCDYSGRRIGGDTGNWSAVASGSFVLPIDALASEWYVDFLYNFNSSRLGPNTGIESASFSTIDLFTGLRSMDDIWDLKLWVKNALDKEATVLDDLFESNAFGAPTGVIPHERVVKPRQVGVTGTYRF